MFQTIQENVTAEITEKKSKFIAHIYYVETIEEAEKYIQTIKKQYFDARHNCYAYRIFTEEGIISKSSDDGEPSGTAGAPILNLLNVKDITNVLIIVTRYFGGILLGTGGLVKAYTNVSLKALEEAGQIQKDIGLRIRLETTYADLEKCKYYFKQNQIKIMDIIYGQNITLIVEITEEKLETIKNTEGELHLSILHPQVLAKTYITI